jgi:hypothetical protein
MGLIVLLVMLLVRLGVRVVCGVRVGRGRGIWKFRKALGARALGDVSAAVRIDQGML